MSYKEEIRDLVAELNQADHDYHVKDSPTLSDGEYDSKLQTLKKLVAKYKYEPLDSPTRRVGSPLPNRAKGVKHLTPMYSLDNAFTTEDVEAFYNRIGKDTTFVIEPKIDGLAVNLVYKDGLLFSATTRGDGVEGEDVKANVKAIKNIPIRLLTDNPPKLLEVRGEIYMPKASFKAYNKIALKQGKKLLINTRNAAAGKLRSLDPKATHEANLALFCYAVGEMDYIPERHTQVLDLLKSYGLPISPDITTGTTVKELLAAYNTFIARRDDLPYDIDGVVYKVNNLHQQKSIGHTSKFPKWAMAHKFPADIESTKVIAIDFQVGRTGVLTPVARLEPIFVAGTTISNATLHNISELNNKDVRIGSRVLIRRAGDVIPEVVKVIPNKDLPPFKLPNTCPACGTKLTIEDKSLVCKNHQKCPEQVKQGIIHFTSKAGLDIQGFGDKVIGLLFDLNIIANFLSLITLTTEDLSKTSLGPKQSKNLITSRDKARNTDLIRFLYALGIPNVGLGTSKRLAMRFKSLDNIMAAKLNDILSVDDIGDIKALSIHNYFKDKDNIKMINAMLNFGLTVKDYEPSQGKLTGTTFVITGKLKDYTRATARKLLESHGGTVASTLSAKVNILIAGEKAGSKLDKAKGLNIPIKDERYLNAL